MSDIEKIFAFTTYLERFKKMERFVGQFFWRDYPKIERYDSNADHTWRMAVMLMVLEPHLAQPIDFKKAMHMLLIHDIPEIIAGDASPLGSDGTGNDSHAYNTEVALQKFESEKRAAGEIFTKLPDIQANELYILWLEYEKQDSFESKIVKAIDKFEGKLQASEYRSGSWFKDHFDFTLAYGAKTFAIDTIFQELVDVWEKSMHATYHEHVLQNKLQEHTENRVTNWFIALQHAWEKEDISIIKNLLAEKFSYYEDPLQSPLTTWLQVEAAWQEIKTQKDKRISIQPLVTEKYKGSALYTLSYKDEAGITQESSGSYYVELNEEGKAVEFRQWWVSK